MMVLVEKSNKLEIIDDPNLSEEIMARVHRDLTRMHWCLGNTGAILRALKKDPLPVRSVVDIGCGDGALLREIRKKLQANVVGVDLRRPTLGAGEVTILQADAVRSPIPVSDIAIAVCVAHHLSEADLVDLIRNVGRYCRRFIVLDLVRHQLPLALFRFAVGPWVHRVTAEDGSRSIRRSYTPAELGVVVTKALVGTEARFRHSVAPLYMRQIIDISYR
ncbi:MAG: methyltransferase domain-containing protein [Bryobacteraceae bacterium]